ncbi:MAG: cytochrome bc complex cytochrome b subunit [Pseudanabaena sp. SU_2_4]|nr:cytochrome bc complex cytochrome b subunit [Pseudanabaena sp. SU_2_4]
METTRFDITVRRITTLLSVVIITLVAIGATTGVLISFYYEPGAGKAYESLARISTEVTYGWLFLKAHDMAGNGVIVVGLIQIIMLFLSRQFRKNWLAAWISGILFTLSAIGLSWTAIILDWSQEGYWRFNIELGTVKSLPVIGNQLRDILTGGGGSDRFAVQPSRGNDIVLDFNVGEDFLELVDGLQFSDVSLEQSGLNTLIGRNSDGEELMVLNNVIASSIDASAFISQPLPLP